MTPTAINFVHVNGRSLYINWRMVVVVGGGNVIHHVKREGNCPGGGMSGRICPGGSMSGEMSKSQTLAHVANITMSDDNTLPERLPYICLHSRVQWQWRGTSEEME